MMKATGMVSKVDELGRIVIPIELRRTLRIDEKAPLEIFVDGNALTEDHLGVVGRPIQK